MRKSIEHQTIRIWSKSVKKLRLIYALTGETMVSILERLLTEELQRIQEREKEEEKHDIFH